MMTNLRSSANGQELTGTHVPGGIEWTWEAETYASLSVRIRNNGHDLGVRESEREPLAFSIALIWEGSKRRGPIYLVIARD